MSSKTSDKFKEMERTKEEIANNPEYINLYGRLEDKFGDNGVVSVVIGHKSGSEINIELWLMSCRVLKRDMEFAMMDEFVKICKSHGIKKIIGNYYPTAKNSMVKNFYELHGFKKISEDENGNATWEISVSDYESKNTVIKLI